MEMSALKRLPQLILGHLLRRFRLLIRKGDVFWGLAGGGIFFVIAYLGGGSIVEALLFGLLGIPLMVLVVFWVRVSSLGGPLDEDP